MPRRTYDTRRGRGRPFIGTSDWSWLLDELRRRHRPYTRPADQENNRR